MSNNLLLESSETGITAEEIVQTVAHAFLQIPDMLMLKVSHLAEDNMMIQKWYSVMAQEEEMV